MKIIITVFLSCFLSIVFAQNSRVRGRIVDEKNETVFGAIVRVKNSDVSTVSNDQGQFQFLLNRGVYEIEIRNVGYERAFVNFEINQDTNLFFTFTLKPLVLELKTVEIKVGKFDKPLDEQTVSMQVIKPQLIENKNTRSIETALDQTPGLNILDGEPQIRGGSGFTFGVGSKVAVIVDDMPMLSGDAGRPEWGFIPVENINQVEVIKGAASVLSGSSALSGSIHIRTAFPGPKPVTKINAYSGMYSSPGMAKWNTAFPGIFGVNFLHSKQIKNLDLVIGGNYNYDHGYIGPPITDSLVATIFPDTISNFKERQMVAHRIRLNFNLRYRSKKYEGLTYGLNGNAMLSHSAMALAWLNDSSGLFRAYPGAVFLQDQFIFNLDPFINYYTSQKGKHSLRTRILHTDNEMTANQSNRATSYYADYLFQKKLTKLKQLEFIGGITGNYVNSFSSIYVGSGTPNNKLLNLSAYTQGEIKIGKRLNLSAGMRLEYFQLNDTIQAIKPIFRAGASMKFFKETYVRASFGEGYRFPTITERFIKTGVGNFGVFPNPDLKSESSWNAELGMKQGFKLGNTIGFIDVAGFWQEYQNTIEYMFGVWHPITSVETMGSSAGFKFLNTGKSRVLGIDASMAGMTKLSPKLDLNFIVGYNYIVPTTLSPDYVYAIDSLNRVFTYNSTSLDPSNKVLKYRFLHNVKADFEFVYAKKISFGISAKYFSKIVNMDKIIEDFEQITVDNELLQDIRYMDYYNAHRFGNWIFDARLSYQINEKHKLAIISSNIFNRIYSLRPLKIEPPRTIMLQYTLKF
ncbi:MAG: TonB-dependent receptor [Crocinitomicaceae bacterium]|nr:TonB-dependent receptor [Crocinitomicaceae bacterium]